MEPEDYTLTPSGQLGGKTSVSEFEGKFVGEFDTTEDALQEIQSRMDREQFWPNIWWISDHGNSWPIDIEGNDLRMQLEA